MPGSEVPIMLQALVEYLNRYLNITRGIELETGEVR